MRRGRVVRVVVVTVGGALAALAIGAAFAQDGSSQALIARGKSLELKTSYVPPPGDPLEHHTSGFAKTMCSAVFITGLDPAFAAEHVGYFTGPYAQRAKVGKPVVDRAAKTVQVAIPNGPTLTAKYLGSQLGLTSKSVEAKLADLPRTRAEWEKNANDPEREAAPEVRALLRRIAASVE